MARRRFRAHPLPILLAGSAAALHAQVPTPIVLPVLKAQGYVDNSFVTCGASTMRVRKVGAALELHLVCGSVPITCTPKPAGLSITNQRLDFNCLSAQGTGAFRALALPQATMVQPGGMAALQVQVYNSTSGALNTLAVSAPAFASACTNTRASLPAGGVWQYACSVPNISADVAVPFQVSARTAANQPLAAQAQSRIMVLGGRLGITVTPPEQTLLAPGAATWLVTVANSGTTQLTGVMAADDDAGSNCLLEARTLAPFSLVRYQCAHPGIVASFGATHTAQGWDGVRTQSVTQRVAVRYGDVIFHSGFEQPALFANGFERP